MVDTSTGWPDVVAFFYKNAMKIPVSNAIFCTQKIPETLIEL